LPLSEAIEAISYDNAREVLRLAAAALDRAEQDPVREASP
jgi:hypothetical protein